MESMIGAMDFGLTYFCILGADGFWATPSLLTSLWEHQLICSSFSSAFLFFLNQSQYQASI